MMMAAENIGRVLAGQDPLYVVNHSLEASSP
jgi:hypothetical protein